MTKHLRSEMGHSKRIVTAAIAATLALAGLTARSPGGSRAATKPGGDAAAVEGALKKGGSLTYWAWSPVSKAKVAAFEAAYPKVKVNWQNVASGGDEYVKISNALKAGSGAPDVAQFEYTAMSQYELSGDLLDLSGY